MVLTNEEVDQFLEEAGVNPVAAEKEQGSVDNLVFDSLKKPAAPANSRFLWMIGALTATSFALGLLMPSPLSLTKERAALQDIAAEMRASLESWQAERAEEDVLDEQIMEDVNPPYLEEEIIEPIEPTEFSFA